MPIYHEQSSLLPPSTDRSSQQEEGNTLVAAGQTEQQHGLEAPEKNRVSAEADVDDGSYFARDPELSSEEVVSDRKDTRHAVTHVVHKSCSSFLVTGLAGPNNTLSVCARKQKTPVRYQQPSQPPCAMEDGKDLQCTRPAQAVLSARESFKSLNEAESWKRASLEVGEPSSAAFWATRAVSELVLTHPPSGATRAKPVKRTPDDADPSFEPAFSRQVRLDLLGLEPRGRPRRARVEVGEAIPPFFYVASARVLEDAGDTEMSWGPFVDEELPFNDNREFVKAKSMAALLMLGDDQQEQ